MARVLWAYTLKFRGKCAKNHKRAGGGYGFITWTIGALCAPLLTCDQRLWLFPLKPTDAR